MARTLLPRITGHRSVVPAHLDPEARAVLTEQLYAVHRQIFDGDDATGFRTHVVEAPGAHTVIRLHLGTAGAIVGYCAVHRFRRRLHGRDLLVLRAEAGLLPDYRGRGASYAYGMRRAALEKLRHPLTPVIYLDTLVHSSSYHLLCTYFPDLFPRPDGSDPAAARMLARELIESFPDPAVSAEDPLVRDDGWITRESPQERWLNQRDDRPDVVFFRRRNPGYARGHGLVVLVTVNFVTISRAALLHLFERLRLAIARRAPDL